jgi:hypothetical protein
MYVVKNKKVKLFEGGIDEYRKSLLKWSLSKWTLSRSVLNQFINSSKQCL